MCVCVSSTLGLKVKNKWKYGLKITKNRDSDIFQKLSSPSKRWKCLESAFLEVFLSEPSNPHSWNTRLKILSDSVIYATGFTGKKQIPDKHFHHSVLNAHTTEPTLLHCLKLMSKIVSSYNVLLYSYFVSRIPRDLSNFLKEACARWNYVNSLSLIHIWRCRRSTLCRSRWSPYH